MNDIFKKLESLFDHNPETHLCHCGSMKDAFDIAEKLIAESLEHDCISWSLQVATAHALLARAAFREWNKDLDPERVKFLLKNASDRLQALTPDSLESLLTKEVAKVNLETYREALGTIKGG